MSKALRIIAIAVVTAIVAAVPSVAGAAAPQWREQVAQAALQPLTATPAATKSRLVDRLRPEVRPPLKASHLDAVANDATAGYVDEIRPRDLKTAALMYAHDRQLASDLQTLMNRQGPAPALLASMIDLLAADRASAAAVVGDLGTAVAGGRNPGHTVLLWASRFLLARGDQSWRSGDPVQAITRWTSATSGAFAVFRSLGISYGEESDGDGDGVPDLLELRFGANPRQADTDGDGLTDAFEIMQATGAHLPDRVDTDGNGVPDPGEDVDGDGLTALEEQGAGSDPLQPDSDDDDLDDLAEAQLGTRPLDPDSDDDGATDGAEVAAGTDPLDPDTDDDGILDGADVATAVVAGPAGVAVGLTGVGDLAGGLTITPSSDPLLVGAPGQVTAPIRLDLADAVAAGLQSATLTLPFDPAAAGGDPNDLRVFTFNEDLHFWVPAADDQVVDVAAGTVTATVTHFSVFAIFNVRNWSTTFTGVGGTCARDGGTGGTVFVDVAFVLDSSGSMSSNDPQGLRRDAAKQFVDALLAEDQGTVVDFDDSARLLQALTNDKALLRAAIDQIDSSGGTNIGAGVAVGLDALAVDTDDTRAQILILLTDGEGAYTHDLTDRASRDGVVVYTIGLGPNVDATLLTEIAQRTGGSYHAVADAGDLPDVFREIEEDTGDDGTDTDGDGLTDCEEEKGVTDGGGLVFTSDPQVPDTDGDGLTDGEEADNPPSGLLSIILGPLYDTLNVHVIFSDPRLVDTDGDGLTDPEEANLGTRARSMETDGDAVGDYEESQELGTDPTNPNTDGDKRDDGYEVLNAAAGFDPQVPDIEQSKWSYAKDFTLGATCPNGWGICERDTIAWLAGNIGGGFFGYKDILDVIGSLTTLDFVGAGLSAAFLIPFVGDAGSVVAKGVRFVRRVSQRGGDALAFLLKLDSLPLISRMDILRQVDGATVNRLRGAGVTDEAIIAYTKKRLDFRLLDRAIQGASAVRRSPALYGVEKHAEDFLRASDPDALPRQIGFRPPGWKAGDGTRGYRYPDVYNPVTQVATEVKNGYWDAVPYVRKQIQKDLALIADSATPIRSVEWHFFPHTNGTVGPSQALLDLLQSSGIPYVIHTP